MKIPTTRRLLFSRILPFLQNFAVYPLVVLDVQSTIPNLSYYTNTSSVYKFIIPSSLHLLIYNES